MVHLWSSTTGTLVASALVGPDSDQDGQYYYTALDAPVTLKASIPTPALSMGVNLHPCPIPRPESPPLLHP